MISNGYINPTPLADLIPYLDAANIDLKSLDDTTYRTLTGGRLQPVLDTLLALKKADVWIEITHLVIPQQQTIRSISKLCANGLLTTALKITHCTSAGSSPAISWNT